MIFQIFLILFALFLMRHVFIQYRRGKVNKSWVAIWSLFSAGVVVVAVIPEITNQLAARVGVGRGADLVIYISLALLFVVVLRHTMHLQRLETEWTELIRKIAVDRAKEPEKK